MTSFSASIDAWVAETKERQTAVFRESAQRVVEAMQRTVPVDTGFLRASLEVRVNEPLPPATRVKAATVPEPSYGLSIIGAEIGDYITVGYAAEYGPYLEFGTATRPPIAWIRGAAAQWPQIVSQVAAQAKAAR